MDVSTSLIVNPSDGHEFWMQISSEYMTWVKLRLSMNQNLSLSVSLTESKSIEKSAYEHECKSEFDCEFEWRYESMIMNFKLRLQANILWVWV